MIKAIYAMNKAGYFGGGNGHAGMPWPKCSRDMKRFKELTTGSYVAMGYKTWLALGRKFLPGRKTVLSIGDGYADLNGEWNIATRDLDITLKELSERGESVFVIGGKKTIEQAISHIDEIHISVINDWSVGDTRSPHIDLTNFSVTNYEHHDDVEFYTLRRKNAKS